LKHADVNGGFPWCDLLSSYLYRLLVAIFCYLFTSIFAYLLEVSGSLIISHGLYHFYFEIYQWYNCYQLQISTCTQRVITEVVFLQITLCVLNTNRHYLLLINDIVFCDQFLYIWKWEYYWALLFTIEVFIHCCVQ
jgi:hypothetical protein